MGYSFSGCIEEYYKTAEYDGTWSYSCKVCFPDFNLTKYACSALADCSDYLKQKDVEQGFYFMSSKTIEFLEDIDGVYFVLDYNQMNDFITRVRGEGWDTTDLVLIRELMARYEADGNKLTRFVVKYH